MSINKIQKRTGEVLLDLTSDTVTPATLAKGVIAHDRSGTIIEGIATTGGSNIKGGYTVTFISEDSEYSVISVTAGQNISRPTAPKVGNKHFIGWFTSKTDGDRVSFPYKPTEDTAFYAHYEDQIIVGVTGLSNSNGVLTLTDDAVGLEGYTENQNGNYVSIISPLQEFFPFNLIEEFTDSSNNVFVKYPKIWMKWETDENDNITGYKFSNGQVDDTYFIPDAFLDPNYTTNDSYLDYFALGKYEASGSSSKLYSKSGATCLVNIKRSDARTGARSYGTSANLYNGYQQLDLAQLTIYNLLCMMFYQTANIQKVYGGRTGSGTVASWGSASVTGTCDGVEGLNGWNTSTDCVKMLGIENPYGNIFKWVDGIYFSTGTIYIQRFPQKFVDSTSNSINIGFTRPTSDGYITVLKHGTKTTTQSYVYSASNGGSASTYYGDYNWYNSQGVVLYAGGIWSNTSNAGLWNLRGSSTASAASSNIGARLSYRPL